MPPVLVLTPPLKKAPLWMIVYFLRAIDARERIFEEGLVGKKGDLECKLKISMKAPVCD